MAFLEQNLHSFIQCGGTIYIVVALILLFFKTPKTKAFSAYRVSKNFLALSFMLLGANLFAWQFLLSGDWFHPDKHIIILDLALFYFIAKLFSLAFSNLLDNTYVTPRRIRITIMKVLAIMVFTIVPLSIPVHDYVKAAMLAVPVGLTLKFYVGFVRFLLRRFRKVKKDIDNYYTEDHYESVQWIHRCIILLVFSGILATITMVQGVFFNMCFQAFLMSFNLYFVISFLNFKDSYAGISRAFIPEPSETANNGTAPTPDPMMVKMEEKIKTWMKEKKYKESQFTIEDIAQEIGTNKTYLSNYINTKFGVNFSVWVTKLRINEAKELMLNCPDSKLETIAFETGFTSSSYFSKVFSKFEGVSPAAWRKDRGGKFDSVFFIRTTICMLMQISYRR